MMEMVKQFRIIDILLFSTIPLLLLKYALPIEQYLVYCLTAFLFNYFIFSFNDFMDKDKDIHDPEKRSRNPFLNEKSRRPATILMLVSGILLIVLGLFKYHKIYLNILLFLVAFNYSASIRAKNKPFVDIVVHGAWIVGIIFYGIVYFDIAVTIKEATLLFHYSIISTLIEMSQGIRDYQIDKETQENTTVVYLGLGNAKKIYAMLIGVFSGLTPILVANMYLKYIPLLFFPMYFVLPQKTYDQRANFINLVTLLSVLVFFL